MKFIVSTLTSVALLATHISALPATEVAIVIKTGDGDSSVGATLPVGKLVPASLQASSGVSAEVSSDSTISCQAFSDTAGTTKLGSPFTADKSAQFGKSSGGTDSVLSDAVPIGAFCCVVTTDGFGACGDATNNNNNQNVDNKPTPPPANKSKTVRVQLNGASEASAQGEVPADNSAFVLAQNPPFFTEVSDGFIQNSEGLKGVSCQAFSDTLATEAVGAPFGENDVDFNGGKLIKVEALRCKSA